MSKGFTREQDDTTSPADIGERPVSTHRNLVTREGLAAIESELSGLREELARAEREGDREKIALTSRDLRYWQARRENAELSVPEGEPQVVRFGMTVTISTDDEKTTHRWTIVGEDEADAANGKISHVSPMAAALFGRAVGEEVTVSGKTWEIVSIAIDD